ncbi:PREDICTED: protein EFFECTOR OF TRANSCRIPTION 1-like [Camelina sativa]|uniref:Protein EFFECTOR OF TRANSCRIPTION 1-like n=1 Tax=Camelina sativa TaxID=90675 RepID=A0ABM0UYV1_CAMSA|nr:PREDICTED: protein EFFECTOR OF TRANSCRIPTION 1-like [Camelina sativa]
MFKRDDYIRTNHDAVFPKWQGFARSMLLRKPISETAELRKTYPDYSLISRDLGPKILIGDNKENFRKGKDCVGRYRVQEALPGLSELGVSVINHDQGRKNDGLLATLGQAESIKYRLRSYGRSITHHDLLKKLGDTPRESGLSQTQKKAGNKTEENKHDSAEERDISSDAAEKESNLQLSPSRPQPVSDRHSHDDLADGSNSASVCGLLLEDGTTCNTTPIKGRKRCTEHKGKKLSRVSPVKLIPSEVPTRRECQETDDDICGVILPDMVRCRRPPVLRRKRCEDHKGMRVNAFFFLLTPTERDEAVKEDKSKLKTCTGLIQEGSGLNLVCEATTNNGLPCTRRAPKGSKRCWQHKDKTVDHGSSSENVQSATTRQLICGVKLYNGSVCEKAPVKGRKRCEEHKGMRIAS